MKTCDQRSFATFGTRAKVSLRDLHISFAVDKPLTIERTSRLEYPTFNQAIFFLPGWIFSVDLAFFKKVARWIVKLFTIPIDWSCSFQIKSFSAFNFTKMKDESWWNVCIDIEGISTTEEHISDLSFKTSFFKGFFQTQRSWPY